MTDNDIKTICEKIDSLHAKILNNKFSEIVTESEMLSLILAVKELNRQKTEIEAYKHYYNECLNDLKKAHAEIEKLEAMVDAAEEHFSPLPFKNKFDEYIEKSKSEAIREFAERLLDEYDIWTEHDAPEYGYVDGLVNNLVEKMTGEKLQ